jgi:hypothetical protein
MEVRIICREFPFRRTGMGAITRAVVVVNGKVVQPIRSRRSRTGNHGEDHYCLLPEEWKKSWIVVLEQSNSGRRYIHFENVPENAAKAIEEAWVSGASVNAIMQLARMLYQQYSK